MSKRAIKIMTMILTSMVVLGISAIAFAQGAESLPPEAMAAIENTKAGTRGWIALAAGLGIGLAAFGGALAQGRAAAQALDGISRNPGAADKMFTPILNLIAL